MASENRPAEENEGPWEMKPDEKTFAEQLLRKKKVAIMLDCSLRSVDRLVATGRLTRIPVLGAVRFRLSDVQMLMNGGVR